MSAAVVADPSQAVTADALLGTTAPVVIQIVGGIRTRLTSTARAA